MNSAKTLLLACLLGLTAAVPPAAGLEVADLLKSGPMVGYGEMTETAIWLQTQRPARVQLRFWPWEHPESARLSEEIVTGAAGDHIAFFRLTDLATGTRYAFEVYLEGERLALPYETAFSTQPMWRHREAPPDIRIAFGSCAYINDAPFDRPGNPYGGNFEIFDSIAEAAPDLMLWIGDNVYYREADWLSEAAMRYRYAHTRALPEMQRLLAATHHYAVWDDHDYGPNNSDRSFRLRQESLEIFKDYWANPSHGALGTDGVFTRVEWGDIELFLLDDRYHRTPLGYGEQIFGEAQMAWLRESLLSSGATFKLIASGNQMLNGDFGVDWLETWGQFPKEQRAFLDFLAAEKIEGVVFLSGDRHKGELLKVERPGLYPLYEITSSPLTAGMARTPIDADNPLRVAGTEVYQDRNFGLVEVVGPEDDRRLVLRLVGSAGNDLWRHEIPYSELSLGD